jgi:hypothetical protein
MSDRVPCSVRLSLLGDELVGNCVCGWSARVVLRLGREAEQASALVGQHLRVDGLLLELSQLIGPAKKKA